MSTVALHADRLDIELTPAEKVAGLHGDVHIPLSAITSVEVVPDGLAAAHGLRAPGLSLPGVRKVGTWRTRAGSELVVVSRGEAAVRISLRGQKLSSVLVGVDDAEGLASRLRAVLR
ncbi:hypothetical protein [Micromonospora sp. NPDC049301]|uniref:hypothetical protein n=1 Tax=Micromonospora sp. NPDC049301 TaxID=3155723 RepID=UPI00342FA8D2